MKKLLALAVGVMMAILMIVPVSAEVKMYNDKFKNQFGLPSGFENAEKIAFSASWKDGATNARHATSEGFDYIFLKEDGKGDYTVEFEVDKDGIYTFAVRVMGWSKSVLRSTDFIIDDGPRCYMAYDYADDDKKKEQYFYGVQAMLKAGKHTATLSLSEDFDDSKVKSLYITDFLYTWEEIPEIVGDKAPAAAAKSAATFDASILAAAALVVSGAGVVVSKKRKQS